MPSSGGSGSHSPAPALLTVSILLGIPGVGLACPCGPGAAPVSTLTTAAERFAVRTSVTGLIETASWDERGVVRRTPPGVRSARLLVELALAWRPLRPVELSLLGGFGAAWVELPGVSSNDLRRGDVSARVRWEVLDRAPWRLAGFVTVRAPTGDTAPGALANGIPSLGLGVWEFAPGLEGSYRDDTGQFGFSVDGGPRTARNGWQPGARLTTTLFGAWRFTTRWTLTGSVTYTWELASTREGHAVPGSATRRPGAGAGFTWRPRDDLALSVGVSLDPWIDALGANAIASARATVGATWSR